MGRKKSRLIRNVKIDSMAAEGKCIARAEDDKVIFTKFVAPGDIVDLRITKNKKNYAEAIPEVIKAHGPLHKKPFCSYFGTCGGCKWQHVPYASQAAHKEQEVKDALERIGGFKEAEVLPILGAPDTRYYRNKMEYTFSDQRWLSKEEIDSGESFERRGLGLHIPGRFDKILDIDRCHLQKAPSNAIRNEVRRYAIEKDLSFFNPVVQEGFLRNLIIRTTTTGEVMVVLQCFEDHREALEALLEHLLSTFPEITSLQYIINPKKNDSIFDMDVYPFKTQGYITEEMVNGKGKTLWFRIGPKSFFQTNIQQGQRLYQTVRDFAGLCGTENVYDLYTGTGSIALFLAGEARHVTGVESVDTAIEDAKLNASVNGIGNTTFLTGDMKDLFNNNFIADHGQPDVIVADPPRAGMHEKVVEQIKASGANRLVYVSCNPATQARDLEMLSDAFRLIKAQPVDMFPQTHHVENVCLLEKR